MAFGLKVWDANGELILDTTHKIPRLVYTQYLTRGSSGSVEIPAVADKSTFFIANCVNPSIERANMPLGVKLISTTLSWYPRQEGMTPEFGEDTLVFVFIYD